MIVFILTLIGMFLGGIGSLSHSSGWLVGGMAGFALGQWIILRRRLASLEKRFAAMDRTQQVFDGAARAEAFAGSQEESKAPAHRDFIFESDPPEVSGVPESPAMENVREWTDPSYAEAETQKTAFSIWRMLPEWVTGGNLLVKIGVVILFFGAAFLLKFASEYGLVPIELRLASVAVGGMALLAAGWRLRNRRMRYALALQGGGVGILYLTIFATLRLYHLLPAGLAFALLVVICALSAFLAVIQDSRSLAVLGASGGFLAPVLASTGSGSHVALFSYYALLNGGIIGIAWYRSWRLLNLTGFVFTFGIGAIWGSRYYHPAFFATVEPFLLLFVAMYVIAAILFSHRQPPDLRGYVDGTLVFGTPIVAFALQAQLVGPSPHGLAWSAVGFGLFYLCCAWAVFARLGRSARLLAEAFLAFSVLFSTLAIPLALDGRWTAATWGAEGAALVWIGVRQKRFPARAFGMLLLFGAGIFFLMDFPRPTAAIPVLNGSFLGAVIISGAALIASRILQRHEVMLREWERALAIVLFAWGMLWWFGAGALEVQRHVPPAFLQGGSLIFVSASAALCSFLVHRLSWPLLSWPALGLVPFLSAIFIFGFLRLPHPFAQGGLIGWPIALFLLYRILYRQEAFRADLLHWGHAAALWLVAAVLTVETVWVIDRLVAGAGVWPLTAWGLVPALVVLLLSRWGERLAWPVRPYRNTYMRLGLGPVVLFAWLWAAYVNVTSNGDPWPLTYLPLLNPLDIAIGFVAVGLWCWQAQLALPWPFPGVERRHLLVALALSLFFWLNGILVRTVHHWGEVPFDIAAMARSTLLQTALSIAWSLIALGVMTIATRRGIRPAWMAGGALLALVVAKLFLVDLSGTGSIERIVSFVGVGLLILLVGWFSPAPPGVKRSSS